MLVKINTFKIKAITFFITLMLMVFYDYLPSRSLNLHPQLTTYIDESVDSDTGGNSQLQWLDKENLHWECELKKGVSYPYCGISVAWSGAPFKQLDLSSYDAIEVDLEYQGEAKYIRIFLRNYYFMPNMEDAIGKAKFNSISKAATAFEEITTIPFSELRVADWWIDDNHIPPEDIRPDVRNVIAVGLDIPYPNVLGRHEFKLHSLKVVGNIISKESFYLTIIIFWTILLLLEMTIKQSNLNVKLKLEKEQLQELKTKSALYQQKAEHDKLTGVLNREGLNRLIEDLHSTKILYQYTLLVVDIDYFKKVNDEYGHVTGDKVLQETVNVLTSSVRSYDIVARWGGEEFVILFHCMSKPKILPFAEKLRKSVESASFFDGKINNVTVSIGATNLVDPEGFEEAFVRADKALYQAKENGRNQTIIV